MKKALALMLALMMTAAMGVTSFADIPVIDLTEDIGSASGTYIKISDSDIWTAPPSSSADSATYYTNGVGGVVYFSMIFKPNTYKNIKVETTGIVSAEVLDYDPAVYSADDEVWKSISEDINFSINDTKSGSVIGYDKVTTVVNKGTYDEGTGVFTVTEEGKPTVSYAMGGTVTAETTLNDDKTQQTVVTVETINFSTDYIEVRAAAKALNDAGMTTRYEATCNQDVHIVKVKIADNFGVNYAKGSFRAKATGASDGKAYAGIRNDVIADVAIASKDTVEYYAEHFKANAKGEIFPINETTGKSDFGYWDFYEDRMSSGKAFVISTTAFRAIAGEGLTLANKSSDPSVIVEIDKVSATQTGVNFLNDSGAKYKKVNGDQVFDNYYLDFYGTQPIASDFTINWKPGCTYGELLTKFGMNTDETEKLTFHLNIDGKDTTFVIDYGKVNLYDEVEIEIERKAGSSLGRYVLSGSKVVVENKPGSGSGSGSNGGTGESNPNTGAEDMVGVVAAMAVVSMAAGAALMLKKRK
ncbi:MAG: LPXTG cell wall anchor domain-containing protein [Oscillospiraceae bacterium]|nr:LPXTG cell wall anchor domain-containing protein [Oscillospiraceae bacterium]